MFRASLLLRLLWRKMETCRLVGRRWSLVTRVRNGCVTRLQPTQEALRELRQHRRLRGEQVTTLKCLREFHAGHFHGLYSLRFAGRSTVSLAAYRSVYSAASSAGHLLVPGFLRTIAEAIVDARETNSR